MVYVYVCIYIHTYMCVCNCNEKMYRHHSERSVALQTWAITEKQESFQVLAELRGRATKEFMYTCMLALPYNVY